MPADLAPHPGDRLDQLPLAVALDAGDAEDLAGAHVDREVVDRAHTPFVLDIEAANAEHDVTRRSLALVDLEDDVAADHQVGQRLLGCGLRVGRSCDPSVAEHRDPVGDRKHLAQLVGDEHDRFALIDQAANHTEELVDLAWREHRCRFVEDQDVGLPEQRLHELDSLLLADGEVPDFGVGIDDQPVLLLERSDTAPGFGDVEQSVLGELVAEDHVLGNGEHRDQLEVLVHHADPVVDRIVHA